MADKELFIKNLKEARDTIDKELLVLSTAALGFSAYFVQIVGTQQAATYMGLLISSCWAFGLTIITALCSHASCERHCLYAYDYINTGSTDADLYEKAMLWNRRTPVFNYISLLLLFAGIILFLLYATFTFLCPA